MNEPNSLPPLIVDSFFVGYESKTPFKVIYGALFRHSALHRGDHIYQYKSEKNRLRIRCSGVDKEGNVCPSMLIAVPVERGGKTGAKITKLNLNHTCTEETGRKRKMK